MSRPVAVCTMFQDEPEFLPIWQKYYGDQVGLDNCFLINHGSKTFDKCILQASNLIHISKSPQDEEQRVAAIANFTTYLLNYYETVIYTDIDEFLVPLPSRWNGLAHFCAQNRADVTYAVGLNVQHLVDVEPAFEISEGVLRQRSWVRFVSAMCKPLILKKPVKWHRGFHGCDLLGKIEDVYLFHLRNFDLNISLKRIARTRVIERRAEADRLGASHQRVDDATVVSWLHGAAGLPKIEPLEFSTQKSPIVELLSKSFNSGSSPLIDISANALWKIPSIFRNIF